MRFAISKQGFAYIGEKELAPSDEEIVVTMSPATAEETRFVQASGTVIDAKTKQPIAKFRVTPGGARDAKTIYWSQESQSEGRNGKYRKEFTRRTTASRLHALRIDAPGYVPSISRVFGDDEKNVTIDFELQPGKGADFLVLTPDGQPAKGAEIGICTPELGPYVAGGIISPNSSCERTSAGEDGRFSIAPREGPYALMILHESGASFVSPIDLSDDGTIRLDPWARVEGTLRIGGKPAANEPITLHDDSRQIQRNQPKYHISYSATTDQDGKFAIERVVPVIAQVSRVVTTELGGGMSRQSPTHVATVHVLPGETTEVDLSRDGVRVVGKLKVPQRLEKQNDWRQAMLMIQTPPVVVPPAPRPPIPANIDIKKDPEAAQKWFNEWKDTDAGKEWQNLVKVYRESVQKIQAIDRPMYYGRVEPDGSFAFDDIPPGKYQIRATAYARPAEGQRAAFPNQAIAKLEQEIEIDATDDENGTAIKLGELMLE
jgi:hypothetical protein